MSVDLFYLRKFPELFAPINPFPPALDPVRTSQSSAIRGKEFVSFKVMKRSESYCTPVYQSELREMFAFIERREIQPIGI